MKRARARCPDCDRTVATSRDGQLYPHKPCLPARPNWWSDVLYRPDVPRRTIVDVALPEEVSP